MGEAGDGQKIGRDEAAGAVKRRLAERQEAGESEQDIEADSEQAPHQNAVDGVRRESEVRQNEGSDDQADGRQRLDQKGALLDHE